ncbi:sigma-70 family RNA polymerase sigma factor [Streptomyces sulphureus]|uniref:sigma-70 family RNA polymerase sigma factor n=1 Tax=Streptomyces sulphureus TaxID=47758 RepID=UPI00036A1BF0|nr:sigma-70 family RNA polymerase sigma factor [Streptomyces sulphureus]
MELVEQFEAARPRLMSLALRIVGSHHDAEDAVQAAWVRAQAAGTADVANPAGWFTTVTARLCLDLLRTRERRGELPLLAQDVPDGQLDAEEAFLRRERVSRALLVLLDELSPSQRVAYVLHDLFALPFTDVAQVLGTSPGAAKKLASRARTRLHAAPPAASDSDAEHLALVEAFLAAARGGDLARLVGLLAPGAVRQADRRLLPEGVRTRVDGAEEIAEETRAFAGRIAVAAPVLVSGRPGAVVAPGGHAWALIRFRLEAGLVAGIDIAPYAPGVLSLIGSVPPGGQR